MAAPAAAADPSDSPSTTSPGSPASSASAVPAGSASPTASSSPWRSAPVASGSASSQPCASVMFVGVRGSGEKAPFGSTVTGIRDSLASRWNGRGTVRQVWLDYPAADPLTLKTASMSSLLFDTPMPSTPYFDSARVGAERLAALLASQSTRCPREWVVLAGFSQGAQAITEALARTDVSSRLAGAILAGNPDHHPGQNVQELSGTAGLSSIGLSALLYYLRGRVEQVGGSRDSQVKTLIQTTIDVHQGDYDLVQARRALAGHHALISPDAYPNSYSICLSGDLVCDSAPAMARILTMQSTFDQELDRGLQVHRKYTPDRLGSTLDAVARQMNTVTAAASQGHPVPHGQQIRTPAQAPAVTAWGRPQILVAVGAGLLGLAIGIGAGVLGHRRVVGSARHQKQ